ncbi:MAG: metallophosphoesterase [Kouleothrix sp.]
MRAILIWATLMSAMLLVWAAEFVLLERRINALAARLARMSRSAPDAALEDQQQRLQRWSDAASWLLLVVMVVTIALLPPLPSERVYAATQSAAFGWLIIATLILLLELELSPLFYQSIGRMRVRGLATGALSGALALAALGLIITLPISESDSIARPVDLLTVRRFLLGNMAVCGGLTLYREHRRRVRSGDMLRYGWRDSLLVALQTLVLFNVVAIGIAVPLIMAVRVGGLLDPQQTLAAGLNLLAFVWTLVSIAYLTLYFLRRLNQARGFSWLDPPNWRVAMPHLRYSFRGYGFFQTLALASTALIVLVGLAGPGRPLAWLAGPLQAGAIVVSVLVGAGAVLYRNRPPEAHGMIWANPARWPGALARAFRHGHSPALADIVRVTYLRALFAGAAADDQLLEQVAEHAVIAPLAGALPAQVVRFDVIGDPGEGDDSQLYPTNRRHGAARALIGGAQARRSAPASDEQLLRELIDPTASADDPESIDFTIISSDVIYPGGEIFDYERAFYRPNAPRDKHGRMFEYGHAHDRPDALGEILDRSSPYYAIPGNHDWYDSMHGFMLNFTYNAGLGQRPGRLARLRDLPWDWRPWRQADRRRAGALRRRYRLRTVGGYPGQPASQQRLSFFELALGDAPLTVFGLDNGITGSIDHIQYRWLDRRLATLRAQPRSAHDYVIVVLGFPLYVDGGFAGSTEAAGPGPQPQRSYELREIYELLRKHRVDVVMGGDTHAYQRYEASYYDEQGGRHTMYHIVNGGGGAYLSPPMDAGWIDFDQRAAGQLRLSRRKVYHPGVWGRDSTDDARADEVVLYDVFPTMNEMMQKFVWAPAKPASMPGLSHRTSAVVALYSRLATWLRQRYVRLALQSGFTNALNHDARPLLQSYVRVELIAQGDEWQLRLVPYIEQEGQMRRQDHRRLDLPARSLHAPGQRDGFATKPSQDRTFG